MKFPLDEPEEELFPAAPNAESTKRVPREPTAEMIEAVRGHHHFGDATIAAYWRRMFDVAPDVV